MTKLYATELVEISLIAKWLEDAPEELSYMWPNKLEVVDETSAVVGVFQYEDDQWVFNRPEPVVEAPQIDPEPTDTPLKGKDGQDTFDWVLEIAKDLWGEIHVEGAKTTRSEWMSLYDRILKITHKNKTRLSFTDILNIVNKVAK